MNYYVVVAREEYKEEEVLFYQGNYSSKELEKLATEDVRENTIMEYEDIEDCYVHIDFIFKSDSPIKWIDDWQPTRKPNFRTIWQSLCQWKVWRAFTDTAKELAKDHNLNPDYYEPFIKFYIEECRESDRGYFFDSDKYIIDMWWDHNKDLYETKTPFIF